MVSWPLVSTAWSAIAGGKPSATDMYNNTTVPMNDLYARSLAATVSGTLYSGTYSSSAPWLPFFKRISGTSDGNGFITITLTTSSVLAPNFMPEVGSGGGNVTVLHLRNDSFVAGSNIILQMRSASTGAVQASTAYLVTGVLWYQA